MVRRIGLAASAVLLGATGLMLFGAGNAVADSSRSRRSSTPGNSTPDSSTSGNRNQYSDRGNSDQGRSWHGNFDQGSFKPSISDYADDREDEDKSHDAPSSPAPPRGESMSDASPLGELSTSSIGAATGGPMVGGWPATTGAGGTEAVAASTAPTPPNGAEPSAAGSPAAAVFLVQAPPNLTPVASAPVEDSAAAPSVPVEEPAAAPSALDEGSGVIAVPDIGGDALDALGPRPVATGLSPDAHRSGIFVAILALAVLLFLAGHQFAGRDRGLAGARDAESVERFQ